MEFIRRYIILFVALTSVNWTSVLSERKKCNEINAPNLRAKLRSKGRIANFSCKRKFELVGVKFAVCLESGNWSQQIPVCVGTTCRRPEHGPDIKVEELYKGGILKFTCGAGLIRSGPEKLMCDGNKWSDEPPKCIEGTALHCDFEDNGLCGWSQDFDDDFDWTWHQGETPTAQTGPRFDHTTNTSEGHYLYMESSAPQAFGQVTRLLSPPYLPTSMINMCLEFFYHMYGPPNDGDVGDLAVYVKPLMLNTTALGLSQRIFHQSGNQDDQWLSAEVPLPPMDDTFQIVFQATRMKSWSGDIAIDDVRLHSCLEETTMSSGPTESDDTDDEDKDREPPVLKTTERTPLTTTAKPTTDSTATIRTTQLPTTASTPPTTASATPTTVPTPPTITSTLPTTKIVILTTTEPTSTRKSTSRATTQAPSTTSVVTPSLRTTVTTLRTTSTPTSTSSTQTTTTTTTTTSKPTVTSAALTTSSSESTRSRTTTATPIRPTTAAVKLSRPTTVTESTTTTTTVSKTTTSNDITSPDSTAGTTSSATARVTPVKATSESASNPSSADPGLVTADTDESISAAVIPSTSDSTDMTDWSTTKAHVTSTLVTATTDAQAIDDDTDSDNNNADDNDVDNPTTPNENDDGDDTDEDYRETTKSMSSSADYIDYDSTSEYLGQTSTFNTSEGHNGSQASASDNKDGSNDSEASKPSQSDTGSSLSKTHLNHGAVKENDGLPSSSTTEVIPVIIGVAAAVVVAAVVIAVLAYVYARNQRRKQEKEQEDHMNIITEYVETNLCT